MKKEKKKDQDEVPQARPALDPLMKNHTYKFSFLFWLLLCVFLKGVVWSWFVPIWHFPDEQAHFAQIATYVETGKMPPHPDLVSGNLSEELLLSERLLGTERDGFGNNKFTYHPEYNLEYTDGLIGIHEEEIARAPLSYRQTMVKYEAASYPPLYYWVMSFPYKIVYSADIFTRIFIVRIANLGFFLALVGISWLFFKELFSKDEILVNCATVLVAFHPMLTFVSSGVTSDNLYNLLFTLGIYVAFKLLSTSFNLKIIIFMLLILILNLKTKPQGILLLYVYAFPLLVLIIQGKIAKKYIALGIVISMYVGLRLYNDMSQGKQVLPDVRAVNPEKPDLSFMEHLKWSVEHSLAKIVPWYWGVFKWLGVVLPRFANRAINRVMVLALVGILIGLFSLIRKKKFKALIRWLFPLYIAGGYFMILTIWDYFFTKSQGFSFGIQGRYFFPAITAHMGLLLWGITNLAPWPKLSSLLAKLLAIGMVLINLIAFYTVVGSYYDKGDLGVFFSQASQYKPGFAKSPSLELSLSIYIIGLLYLLFLIVKLQREKNASN